MKSRKLNAILAAIMFLALIAYSPSVIAQQSNPQQGTPKQDDIKPDSQESDASPSMEETIAWLKSKLEGLKASVREEYDSTTVADYRSVSSYSTDVQHTNFAFDKCTVSWKTSEKFQIDRRSSAPLADEFPHSIKLDSLDPLNIKVVQVGPRSFGSGTTNKAKVSDIWIVPLGKIEGIEESGPALLGARPGFVFIDREMAKRVAKAFQHAVKLCGGKVEPF